VEYGSRQEHAPKIIAQAEIAPDNVLKEPDSLSLNKLIYHITQHSSDSVEAFIGMADISEASLVKEDFLNNKDGDSFGEFGTCLHDT